MSSSSSSSSGAQSKSAPVPAGSVLPGRFLPVVLRVLLQDLNPSVYASIPFIPTPLVDLIAGYADDSAEDPRTQVQMAATAFVIGIRNCDDVSVHTAVGADCIAETMGQWDPLPTAEELEEEIVYELSDAFASLAPSMPEVAEWLKEEEICRAHNQDGTEFWDWMRSERCCAATVMARMLVQASLPSSTPVHPALTALMQTRGTSHLLSDVRARTSRLLAPPAVAFADWASESTDNSNCTYMTVLSAVCPLTGKLTVSVNTYDNQYKATAEEKAAQARAKNATPPPFEW